MSIFYEINLQPFYTSSFPHNYLNVLILHLLKKRIRSPWIKYLVTGHHRNQILRFAEVNYIVGPARNHVDSFYLVSGNLKLHHLPGVDVTLLNQTVTSNYNKQFPLGIVPMLALRDARL